MIFCKNSMFLFLQRCEQIVKIFMPLTSGSRKSVITIWTFILFAYLSVFPLVQRTKNSNVNHYVSVEESSMTNKIRGYYVDLLYYTFWTPLNCFLKKLIVSRTRLTLFPRGTIFGTLLHINLYETTTHQNIFLML